MILLLRFAPRLSLHAPGLTNTLLFVYEQYIKIILLAYFSENKFPVAPHIRAIKLNVEGNLPYKALIQMLNTTSCWIL